MLIVIATQNELQLVEELGLSDEPIIITGVGGVNVIKALRNVPRDTEILNIGYCGAQGLNVGTFVNIAKVLTLHNKVEFNERPSYLSSAQIKKNISKSVTCFTSTDFVTERIDLKVLNLQEAVFDMELAFICALGFNHIASIKKVSDNLSVNQYEEYLDNKNKRG